MGNKRDNLIKIQYMYGTTTVKLLCVINIYKNKYETKLTSVNIKGECPKHHQSLTSNVTVGGNLKGEN
jgi:hypothetical protein